MRVGRTRRDKVAPATTIGTSGGTRAGMDAGMTAEATINGVSGKLRILDLGTNIIPYARATQFQSFDGLFEQTGAAG